MSVLSAARWVVRFRVAEDVDEGRLHSPEEIDAAALRHLEKLQAQHPALRDLDADQVLASIPLSWRDLVAQGAPEPHRLQKLARGQGFVTWHELATRAETALRRHLSRGAESLQALHELARERGSFDEVRVNLGWVAELPPEMVDAVNAARGSSFGADYGSEEARSIVQGICGWGKLGPTNRAEAGEIIRRLMNLVEDDPCAGAVVITSPPAGRALSAILHDFPNDIRLWGSVGILAEHSHSVTEVWRDGSRGDELAARVKARRRESLARLHEDTSPIGPPSAELSPATDDLPIAMEFGWQDDKPEPIQSMVLAAKLERMGFPDAMRDGGLRSRDVDRDQFLSQDLRHFAKVNLHEHGKVFISGKQLLQYERGSEPARGSAPPEFARFPIATERFDALPPAKQNKYFTGLIAAFYRAARDCREPRRISAQKRRQLKTHLPELVSSLRHALTKVTTEENLGLWPAHMVSYFVDTMPFFLQDLADPAVQKLVPSRDLKALEAELRKLVTSERRLVGPDSP